MRRERRKTVDLGVGRGAGLCGYGGGENLDIILKDYNARTSQQCRAFVYLVKEA